MIPDPILGDKTDTKTKVYVCVSLAGITSEGNKDGCLIVFK
jgi:hypothetical protein